MARRVSCRHGIPPIPAALLTSFMLAAAAPARAQKPSTVTGVVVDQAESVISGARVTATNAGNASVQTALTDAAGAFWLRGLAPGTYTVLVEMNLFSSRAETVTIPAAAPLRIVLEAGGFAESVVVTARRAETRLAETPQKVEVIDAVDIERSVAADLTDVLKKNSGVDVVLTRKENGSMRSISTMRGDAGETSLAGGVRISKASARVETCGTIDELNSTMGFARSICEDIEIAAFTKGVQQDLFTIGSSLATPTESPKPQIIIDQALVDRLTAEVHRLEAIDGMLADWSLPGEHPAAAAFDVARTVCRRAERGLVRLRESGAVVQPAMLAYVNRLSDLLWLFGRKLEHDAGVSASLREATGKTGNRFSRAW